MGSPSSAAGTPSLPPSRSTMKLLALLALTTAGVTSLSDQDRVKYWEQTKSMESCWGEENMKLYNVQVTKAISKCAHVDAPELSLPPYRSAYRFDNIVKGSYNSQEKRRANMVWRLMESIKESYGSHSVPYRPHNNYQDSMDNGIMMNAFLKMMNTMKNEDNYNMYNENIPKSFDAITRSGNYRQNTPMARMSQLVDMFARSRNKRDEAAVAPGDTIGDRLVEKINEKKHIMEEEIGNLTCILKEIGFLNYQNDLDLQRMKEALKPYTMPSPWFEKKYHEMSRACYEIATNLPEQIVEQSVIKGDSFGSVKMAELKTYFEVCDKAEKKLCMYQDIKKKIESNFGPLEEILEQTQLTEYQLFPLVMQLLEGKEMEFMLEDY